MKKQLMAMFLAGSTMTLFAQTTPTTPAGDPNTTQQSAGVTTSQTTYSTNQMNSSTPGSNINTWNGVKANSTSWSPEKETSWRWNNYGVWNSDANWNSNPNNPYGNTMNNTNVNGTTNMNNGMNATANMNSNMNANASMNSTGSYSAYGTAVPSLPTNVQMRFSQDYPADMNKSYSWNQYGDWYHAQQMNNGRTMQYFYDTRGNGYSLALPVLQTFVPENIVNNALNKYGSNLYSISMVKNNAGSDTYMIGLIERGQVSMHYLDESGVTVNDVWRTEEMNESGTMQSTQSNAAMDGQHNMNNQNWNNQGTDDKKMKDSKYKNKKEGHYNDHNK